MFRFVSFCFCFSFGCYFSFAFCLCLFQSVVLPLWIPIAPEWIIVKSLYQQRINLFTPHQYDRVSYNVMDRICFLKSKIAINYDVRMRASIINVWLFILIFVSYFWSVRRFLGGFSVCICVLLSSMFLTRCPFLETDSCVFIYKLVNSILISDRSTVLGCELFIRIQLWNKYGLFFFFFGCSISNVFLGIALWRTNCSFCCPMDKNRLYAIAFAAVINLDTTVAEHPEKKNQADSKSCSRFGAISNREWKCVWYNALSLNSNEGYSKSVFNVCAHRVLLNW